MWWWEKRRRLRLWQKAMSRCNMDEEKMSSFWNWRAQLTARSGSIEVRITDASDSGDGVVVVVEGPEGFSDLKLRPAYLTLWRREIEVGDEAFDREFFIEGPLPSVAARLDTAVQGQLLRASAYGTSLEIDDGRLRVEVSEEKLSLILPTLVSLGRRFAEPLDVKSRLLHNARWDSKAPVRLFNLLALIREHPGDPDTLEVLRGACTDPSSKVRVRAAIELGEEGHDILLKIVETSNDASRALAISHLGGKLPVESVKRILARALRRGSLQTARACLESLGQHRAAAVGVLKRVLVENKGELAIAAAALGAEGRDLLFDLAESHRVDDAMSAEAVSTLDRELSFERTRAVLDQALDRRRIRTARACLEALGKSGDAAAIDALAKVIALEKGELATVAALALGATGSPAAEPPLIDSLQREQADLRVAAASALGRVGSAAAVLPLKEATERSSWLDLDLRRATRQAIAEIQSRLQGASPGQLSLAEGEAGQLSLAQAEAGQLSLAPAGPGRLSLAHAEAGPLSLAPAEIPLLPHPADEPEQPSRNARDTLPPES